MSTYSYRVKIKEIAELVHIEADDVCVNCPCQAFVDHEEAVTITCTHEKAWYNFTKSSGDKDTNDQTVAAIPFDQVLYITD